MNTKTVERGTITVQRIIPPTGNRKSHTVKDLDGIMFGVWPDKIGLYREGESYDIEYTVSEKGFRDITKCQMLAKPAAASPSQRIEPPHQGTTPNDKGAGQFYRPTAPRDAERMFVCSTLNAFIQTGRVECSKALMIDYVNELRGVWQETFGRDDQG